MALKIYWTKRADRKVDRIIEYLTAEWAKESQRYSSGKLMIFWIFCQTFQRLEQSKTKRRE